MTITCIVADDHPPVLDSLARHLSAGGIDVVALARDGDEAWQAIEDARPTVAVIDARMPGPTGLELARRIRAEAPETAIIIYTAAGDAALVTEALEIGVLGLVQKDAPLAELVRAVRLVAAGGRYVDASLARHVLARDEGRPLTERERDVLRLLGEGLSNDEVGRRLDISPETVRVHLRKAMVKLGAATRTHAVAIALRRSLIR